MTKTQNPICPIISVNGVESIFKSSVWVHLFHLNEMILKAGKTLAKCWGCATMHSSRKKHNEFTDILSKCIQIRPAAGEWQQDKGRIESPCLIHSTESFFHEHRFGSMRQRVSLNILSSAPAGHMIWLSASVDFACAD